jgi:hypothetical protein
MTQTTRHAIAANPAKLKQPVGTVQRLEAYIMYVDWALAGTIP